MGVSREACAEAFVGLLGVSESGGRLLRARAGSGAGFTKREWER